MTGVNIHAITEVPIYNHPLIALVYVGILLALVGRFLCSWEIKDFPWPSAVLTMLAVICLILGWYFISCETGYYNTYKATIEENVSLVEFNKKYEILDQEGDIYTIKEREVE